MASTFTRLSDDELRRRLTQDSGDQDAIDALHARHPVLAVYDQALAAAFGADQAAQPFDLRVLAHPDSPATAAVRALRDETYRRWIEGEAAPASWVQL